MAKGNVLSPMYSTRAHHEIANERYMWEWRTVSHFIKFTLVCFLNEAGVRYVNSMGGLCGGCGGMQVVVARMQYGRI